jgi:hypothetical protein
MMRLTENIFAHLHDRAADPVNFWTMRNSASRPDMLAACDVFYVLKLTGAMDLMAPDAPARFVTLLARYRMAGAIGVGDGPELGVHQTAYALGVLNFLALHGQPVQDQVLRDGEWQISALLDRGHRPRWPWYLAHHAWRVGHWIGGIPAIILSLWRLVPELALRNRVPPPGVILESSDTLLDDHTGLFRTYRLEAMQQVFRLLYRLRHHPDAGALGGVAHLHWGNYAAGRLPYKAAPALFDRSWALLQQRQPFMEAVPYCLDFDILHLARTSVANDDDRLPQLERAALAYAGDLCGFYGKRLPPEYTLHKLPGGLAALHECSLIGRLPTVPGLRIPPVDVAREACWI